MLPGIGIFGCGVLAHALAAELTAAGFRLDACWASNDDAAKRFAARHRISTHSASIDAILLRPTVQLIVIAIHCVRQHAQIVAKTCGIGKHVLCATPSAVTVPQMIEMRRAAANYSALISLTVTPLRFVPAFALMRRLIVEEQMIGPIRAIAATVHCDVFLVHRENAIIWDKHNGGGLLATFGTNLIDAIHFITGFRTRKVNATMRTYAQLSKSEILRNNADDHVTLQMDMFDATRSTRSTRRRRRQQRNCKNIEQKSNINLNSNNSNNSKNNNNTNKNNNRYRYSSSSSSASSASSSASSSSSAIACVTLNGMHYDQEPSHYLAAYGTDGYLVCRNGNLYGRLRQTSNTSNSNNSNNNNNNNNNNNCGNNNGSTSKRRIGDDRESIFYLYDDDDDVDDDYGDADAGDHEQEEEDDDDEDERDEDEKHVNENHRNHRNNSIEVNNHNDDDDDDNNDRNGGKSDLINEPNRHHRYVHSLPALYQRGLRHLAAALKNAFFDRPAAAVAAVAGNRAANNVSVISEKSPKNDSNNHCEDNQKTNFDETIRWNKDPVIDAADFDDALHLQAVLDAIRRSAEQQQWIRVYEDEDAAAPAGDNDENNDVDDDDGQHDDDDEAGSKE